MAYQEYQNNQTWPEDTNFGFQPEQLLNPAQNGKPRLPDGCTWKAAVNTRVKHSESHYGSENTTKA